MKFEVPFLDLQQPMAPLRPALDAAYRRVMDSGRYILGAEVERFEEDFAAVAGSTHAVGVGNGLDALAFALSAVGVQAGDDVVVPAHTFIATWLAVRMVGARPVPAEPAPGAFNCGPEEIAAALTPATRAVVVVHLYGEPVQAEAIAALCAERGLPMVEDAAQAHGAQRNGRPAGSLGAAAAFSFYPGKNLGAFGDAGAVTSSDPAVIERVQRLRNYGGLAHYDHAAEGRNSRLDPLQAAFLAVKLPALSAWNERRRAVAARYAQGLAGLPGLQLPTTLPGNLPAWHLYVVRSPRRDALLAHLAAAGVEARLHYPRAVIRCAPFAEHAAPSETAADRLAAEVLSLPMGPHLDDAQVDRVIEAVRAFHR
jgi:dTDP-3-amino-3,4,6-trideoxy-alpha-D-glucose transaminase